MLARLAAGAGAAALAVSVLAGAPAQAGSSVVSSGTDKAGDVRIAENHQGLSGSQLRDIDLRRFKVTDLDGGAQRWSGTIRELASPDAGFVQVLYAQMRKPGSGRLRAVVAMTSRPSSGGIAANPDRECEIDKVRRDEKTDTLSMRVPKRCAVPDGLSVRVRSYLALEDGSRPPSSDTMRSSRTH